MKRMIQWMMAAILICGATTFTSCSVNDDNSSKTANENRKEFIKHTRENLKDLAENLNFRSWELANRINQDFNTRVLNNPEFEKAILPLFIQKIRESVQPVEEGSELAEMGYKQYATIDLTEFNYRFTMKEDDSGFDVEEAEDFEMIINSFNRRTQEHEIGASKLTLQASGDTYKQLNKRLGNEETAVVILVPANFEFTLAKHFPDGWREGFKGSLTHEFIMSGESEYVNPKADITNVTGSLVTAFADSPDAKYAADATELYFSFILDPIDDVSNLDFTFTHNNKKMVDLSVECPYEGKNFDFSQFNTSGSILDVLVALMAGNKENAIFMPSSP